APNRTPRHISPSRSVARDVTVTFSISRQQERPLLQMKLRILHHDHCFDGFASAAVFSRFFKEKIMSAAEIAYTGLAHKPNQKLIEEELFDGDQNAIVDFKYSPSPRLTWWFDHHQSAFLSPEDET